MQTLQDLFEILNKIPLKERERTELNIQLNISGFEDFDSSDIEEFYFLEFPKVGQPCFYIKIS